MPQSYFSLSGFYGESIVIGLSVKGIGWWLVVVLLKIFLENGVSVELSVES